MQRLQIQKFKRVKDLIMHQTQKGPQGEGPVMDLRGLHERQ